jgi:hypothetical protein
VVEGHGCQVRAEAPGGLKGGAAREHQVEAQRRHLVEQQRQEFQGRGVHPVQVFHNQEDRLLLSQCPHQGQDGVEGALALLLGREMEGRIALGG